MKKIKNEEHWERGDFDALIDSLSKEDSEKRHTIRYALFRVQNEYFGNGNVAEKEHDIIATEICAMEDAGDVKSFAHEWDVGAVSPKIFIVKRMWSIYQEHEQLMKRIAVPVTKNDTPETLAAKAKVVEDKEKKRFKAEEAKKKKRNK